MKSSIILSSLILLSNVAYGDTISKESITENQRTVGRMDDIIQKRRVLLLKTRKSNVARYASLYDDVAKLTISKNNLLINMDKAEDIDTDVTCKFALEYEEVEFVKTQFYKTPFHDEVAKTLQNIATLYEQCEPSMAEKYLKSILKIKESLYSRESAEVAKALDELGDYYRIFMADFKRAIVKYEESKSVREKLYGLKDPKITENYERLALSLYYHGDKTDGAEKLLLQSINVIENAPSNKAFPLYVAYMDMGIHYSMEDEYPNSIIYLEKALKEFQGKANNNYIVIVSELSQNYLNQDNLHKALIYAEEAYIKTKESSDNSRDFKVLESLRRVDEIRDMINKEESEKFQGASNEQRGY